MMLTRHRFYGTMPLKMKSVIMTGSPWWLSALLAIMRLFISKKMSKRIHNYSKGKMLEAMGGAYYLPAGKIGGEKPYVGRYLMDAPVKSKVVAL